MKLDAILRTFRAAFDAAAQCDPSDQDVIYRAVLDHVRARRPESVGCLGTLPAPGEAIRDPRTL